MGQTSSLPLGTDRDQLWSAPGNVNVYMAPLATIVRNHKLNIASYADDTQLILSLTNEPYITKHSFQEGMKAITTWM